MAEPQVLSTLKRKQSDIQSYIRALEKRVEQAKHDLAHVNATIRLFEVGDDPPQFPVHVNFKGLYRKGELTRLCLEALESLPERSGTSREIAAYIIKRKAGMRLTGRWRSRSAIALCARLGRAGGGGWWRRSGSGRA